MKIAATYDVNTNSVFQHFGKTQNFKIYEVEDGKVVKASVIDNGGFGHHDLCTYLKDLGVETLILGNRGQGAIDALNSASRPATIPVRRKKNPPHKKSGGNICRKAKKKPAATYFRGIHHYHRRG